MSLATRCAACGTVFRVVQDQLKVSEGWVRCGRCGDVFNALEGLFDLDRETAPAWTPSQRGALDLLPSNADEHAAQAADGASLAAHYAESVEVEAEGGRAASADTKIDTRIDSQVDTRDAERDALDEDTDTVGRGEISEFDFEDADEPDTAAAISAEPRPAFLRQAERAAFWQRPGVRLSLATLATLLGLLLAAQAAVWQRDLIAARWPQAMPLLVKLCEPLDCRIESLRRLDSLAVESSGLTQLDSPSLYRLQVALRNRDRHPLLTPALDVTLTDSRGEIVSRRVFSRRDFGVAVPTTMGAGAELALQVVLDAGERNISGYSIEIFYP
jgi:predicted Zn finger-like uncharacterized protein